ncbi:GNAT family N-acetyltransferase [Kineosporia succinea]|uniref:GNAT superfamily N-acetyltransferase n=1 Tax=Kineosporia succinea TaxID=84632 RepID=A0ABT9NZD6_9ACTN|nr:GNAT family N-acetyltransferase [Kineosporia succinea]MDP9825790.1 GNAT superfamily N-acetyltransferase [Kineosporia succinea]
MATTTGERIDTDRAHDGPIDATGAEPAGGPTRQPGSKPAGRPIGVPAQTPSPSPVRLVRLTGEHWEVLRDLRLRALFESPQAFPVPYERERHWPDARWRERCTSSVWVAAECAGTYVGLARLTGEPPADHGKPYPPHEVRYVESVWVDPSARRQGVLRQMLAFLEVEARRDPKVRRLLLWVLRGNDGASKAYRRLGFRSARGKFWQVFTISETESVWECRLRKELYPTSSRPVGSTALSPR